jgi:hypothetical protein
MNDEHRQTAARWHGGQWSPLYAYASTGAVVAGVDREVLDCLDIVERGELNVDADPVEEHERLLALLRHVEPDVAIGKAGEIGREHGENAAEWWQQDALGGRATGDTATTARSVLQGIDGGDPAILDTLPAYVDGYTATELQSECDWPEPDVDDLEAHRRWSAVVSDLWSEYQTAFQDAVRESVIRYCERELVDGAVASDLTGPIGRGGSTSDHSASATDRSPYLRPAPTSTAGVSQAPVAPTPPGWTADRIGHWDGDEFEVVYDPQRFEVAVTPASGTATAALEASGWALQATDGHLGFWTRDRAVTAHVAMTQHDQRAATETPRFEATAGPPDATRGLEL